MGVSLWQTISLAEAELLVSEILADPGSRLARAITSAPEPIDPEQQQAAEETESDYRQMYRFGDD